MRKRELNKDRKEQDRRTIRHVRMVHPRLERRPQLR